jgi:hypothetical protein
MNRDRDSRGRDLALAKVVESRAKNANFARFCALTGV